MRLGLRLGVRRVHRGELRAHEALQLGGARMAGLVQRHLAHQKGMRKLHACGVTCVAGLWGSCCGLGARARRGTRAVEIKARACRLAARAVAIGLQACGHRAAGLRESGCRLARIGLQGCRVAAIGLQAYEGRHLAQERQRGGGAAPLEREPRGGEADLVGVGAGVGLG